MRKKYWQHIFYPWIVLLLMIPITDIKAQDATEIVRKADLQMRGESSYAEMVMSIIRPAWKREISMRSWSKGDDMALILITGPARDRGTAFLKRGNEIWNWQPTIDRVIKLPPSMMGQSWMGSDFTNDDLVRESSIVNDFTHRIVGDTTIMDKPSHIIEMIPKEGAAIVWGKIIIYIDKKDHLQLKSLFFDEDGIMMNILNALKVERMGNRMIVSQMEMTPADNPAQKTVVEYRKIDFDIPIQDNYFSIQNMRSLRP
jgi:outer membrane lipoprotein-sorting protein